MICIGKNEELTTDLLQKMINHFNTSVRPKLASYKNYYDGIQAILDKSYSDSSKPCNKSVINYCKNIVDIYCGYLATPGCISYSSSDDIEEIMNILKYNDYQSEDSDFLLDSLVYGVANELMYMDSMSQVRFRMISPLQSFGIFDDSLTEDLLYFVRMYKRNYWGNDNTYCVDVYTDNLIKHYTMSGTNGFLTYIGEEPHYFGQCPANVFYLPDEKSIFDCIQSLQDSYNELISSEIDDYQAFCDAYLCLEAVDADDEDIASMKQNRVMLLPQGAKSYYLTKGSNDAQVENMLKRLQDSIYKIAQCPDFSSESFVGGVSSGIAIKYRLTGIETRAGKIEGEMKKALQRRVEIICGMATLKLGEEIFRDIQIDFKRNIPEDITQTINLINSLKGSVSDETLLAQLPFISDVNTELEKVQKQKLDNMSLYSFGTPTDTEEDE